MILGGTQDNGTLKYTPATGTTWTTEFGGDGGASAVDPSNTNYLYGEYAYGCVHRSTDGGASADWINGLSGTASGRASRPPTRSRIPAADSQRELHRAVHPRSERLEPLLVGGASLWRTNDATTPNTATTGPTWASIKAPLGAGNYISAIAVAPGDANVDLGRAQQRTALFKTINGTAAAPTWSGGARARCPPAASPACASIRPTPTPSTSAYGGFSRPTCGRSIDGGTSWVVRDRQRRSPALPAAPVRDIAVYPLIPPGCTPQRKSAFSRARTAARRGPSLTTARRTSRSKSCSGWAEPGRRDARARAVQDAAGRADTADHLAERHECRARRGGDGDGRERAGLCRRLGGAVCDRRPGVGLPAMAVSERNPHRSGRGADGRAADLHVAPDAGHVRAAVVSEQHVHPARDERRHHGPERQCHAECDDGGAGRGGDGDGREWAGQSRRLGGAVCGRRPGVGPPAMAVSERNPHRPGRGADGRDADLHVASDAGHVRAAVLSEQHLHRARDERVHHGRGRQRHAECDDVWRRARR